MHYHGLRSSCDTLACMLSLNDHQLDIVVTAARALSPEKRDVYLRRVAANLQIRCGRFTDTDVAQAAQAALQGLVWHEPAA